MRQHTMRYLTIVVFAATAFACSESLAPSDVIGRWLMVEYNGNPVPGPTVWYNPDGPMDITVEADEVWELDVKADGTYIVSNPQSTIGGGQWELDGSTFRITLGLTDETASGHVVGNRMELTFEFGNVRTFERQN